MLDYESQYSKCTSIGLEPSTARFEVSTPQGHQIFGEELFPQGFHTRLFGRVFYQLDILAQMFYNIPM